MNTFHKCLLAIVLGCVLLDLLNGKGAHAGEADDLHRIAVATESIARSLETIKDRSR